jgi:hypothetical protein
VQIGLDPAQRGDRARGDLMRIDAMGVHGRSPASMVARN